MMKVMLCINQVKANTMAKIKEFFLKNIYVFLLVFVICLVSTILIIVFHLEKDTSGKAYVIYNDEVVCEIDLNDVSGTKEMDISLSSDVTITVEVKKGAIRVIRAGCKHQDCVRMGWTSSPSKPIICLDLNYKIVLSGKSDVDVVIR